MNLKNTAILETSDDWRQAFKQLARRRLIQRNIIVFMLQYAGLMFTTLASPDSLVWFASGTATAFMFLRGPNIMPGIWLGSALAFLMAGQSLILACGCATILALQTWVILKWSYHHSILSLVFTKLKDLLTFVLICACTNACASLFLAHLCYPSLNTSRSESLLGLEWSLANFNGTLILACALFTWDAFFPDIQKLKTQNKAKMLGFFVIFIFLLGGLLYSQSSPRMLESMILIELLIIGFSYCYAWCGDLAVLFALSFILAFAGFFETPLFSLPQKNLTLELEIFLSLCAMSGMGSVFWAAAND